MASGNPGAGRHRGVVVLDANITDAELAQMRALAVRGVRFNLVSPVANTRAIIIRQTFGELAPRLRALGWHVQWYRKSADLPMIAAPHAAPADLGVPAVLDHLAGLHTKLQSDDPVWPLLVGLAQAGAWAKRSVSYRLQAVAPYTLIDPVILQVTQLFRKRMVRGSDWSHTSFAPKTEPDYASKWQLVARTLTAAQQSEVAVAAPIILYS